jgi:hypothetical protein
MTLQWAHNNGLMAIGCQEEITPSLPTLIKNITFAFNSVPLK